MTRRLQVLLDDAEMEQLRVKANSYDVSVGEWVRRAIRRSFEEQYPRSKEEKLRALREAMEFNGGPEVDIEQMNREIEMGYLSGLP